MDISFYLCVPVFHDISLWTLDLRYNEVLLEYSVIKQAYKKLFWNFSILLFWKVRFAYQLDWLQCLCNTWKKI